MYVYILIHMHHITSQPLYIAQGQWDQAKGWLWHGAALAHDDNIYSIPANAKEVLKVNPVERACTLIHPNPSSSDAQVMSTQKNKW